VDQVKNPSQIEFARLLSESGWSAAECARQLKLSKPSISKYLSGEQTPRENVLEAFRTKVHGLTASVRYPALEEKIAIDPNEVEETVLKVRELAEADSGNFRAAQKVIDAFHAVKPAKKRPAKVSSAQKRLAESLRNMAHAKQQQEARTEEKQHPE